MLPCFSYLSFKTSFSASFCHHHSSIETSTVRKLTIRCITPAIAPGRCKHVAHIDGVWFKYGWYKNMAVTFDWGILLSKGTVVVVVVGAGAVVAG